MATGLPLNGCTALERGTMQGFQLPGGVFFTTA